MKQFKGGLYANLGNYKSSLPQTKILNDFFKQNPVGYKKGGEVKGIKGVNYSRIPVTGGFMANAQGFQNGGSVSAFYGKRGEAIRPGRLEAPFIGKLRTSGDNVITEDMIRPFDRTVLGPGGLDYFYPPATDADFVSAGAAPTEFSDARESYIASQPELGEVSKKKRQIAEFNKSAREDYDEMFGEDAGIGGIDSLIDDKKEKKSKLKNADDIKADVDVNYEDASGIRGITKTDTSQVDTELEPSDVTGKLDKAGVFKTKDAETLYNEMIGDDDKFNKILNKQQELTKTSVDAINKIGKEFYDKDGDDAPEWAMPLMMAGLKMAASDNPSLLGALAEGGISGMEEYAKKQAEKRESAKEQIALEMQKMNAIINLQSKDIDVETDFAKLSRDTNLKAFELAYDDYSKQKERIFEAILKDADFDRDSEKFKTQSQIALLELDQRYDLAIAELEKDYLAMADRRSEFKSDIEYKNKLLEIESVKIYNENIKHQNLLELEKVSEGKITTVLMPDDDGNMKEFKIRTYYDYDTEQYENDIIGFAPPDSDYLENLENEIRNQIATGVYEELEGKTLEEIESFISNLVQQKINAEFGDIKATETGAGG
jgi:hypothetical protein